MLWQWCDLMIVNRFVCIFWGLTNDFWDDWIYKMPASLLLGWLCLLCLVLFILLIFVHILHNTRYWDKATFQAIRDAGSRSLAIAWIYMSRLDMILIVYMCTWLNEGSKNQTCNKDQSTSIQENSNRKCKGLPLRWWISWYSSSLYFEEKAAKHEGNAPHATSWSR